MNGKKLSEEHKLPARTAPEIAGAFGRLLSDLQVERAILYNGRKLSGEAIVSAVMLDFLSKPTSEQKAILARRVAEFEAIMRGEDRPQAEQDAEPPKAIFGRSANPPDGAPKRRTRKSG